MPAITFQFEAIGTVWSIEIYDLPPRVSKSALEQQIMNRIEQFDHTYSRFRSDSLVTEMAKKAGRYQLPADAKPLMTLYRNLYDATSGHVTPLIGNLLADAGYDADYSLTPTGPLSSPPAWDSVIAYHHPFIELAQPALLDFGAAGKGYLIDIIAKLLQTQDITSFLIDGSGDILYTSANHETIRIGLEDPSQSDEIVGIVTLGNESICGSASNRRTWGDLHHIMDPKTATPVRDIVATWVVAPHAAVADGLATALFFTPAAELAQSFRFDYFLLRSDHSCEFSQGLKLELFSEADA